jgi:hypothetical protein
LSTHLLYFPVSTLPDRESAMDQLVRRLATAAVSHQDGTPFPALCVGLQ